MKGKHIIAILAAAALTTTVSAQQGDDINYVGVDLGGGLGTLIYDAAGGERSAGGGFEAGLFYGHFFTESVGLGVGLQYSLVHASALYNHRETTNGLVHLDNRNVPYNLMTNFNSWKERQSMGLLSIPVECIYRKPINESWNFVGGVGLSLDMHVGGKYKAKEGSYTLSGTFPALGSYVLSDMPEHGFTTFDDVYDAKVENKTSVGSSLILDAGVRRALNERYGLYMGLYFGYGFTNIVDEAKTAPIVAINANDAKRVDYAGTFDSRATDKAHVMRLGLKVAVDMGWGKREKKVEPKPAPAPAVDKDAERLAAEKAAAAAKAEAERLAAEKAAAEKAAAEKAAAERLAAEQAAAAKAAAEKAEAERLAAEKAAAAAKAEAERAKKEAEDLIKKINATVYFGSAGANITLDAETDAAIQAICKAMIADKTLKVVVTGFTDSRGALETNMKYGLKRAEALRDYMVKQGAPVENIACESKGPKDPIADNNTAEGRAKNRRATVKFL
ncbi:MAG: OmpA family protein [Bacteroidales bacterium]|nr:OmpA family protein [Bacteroidales bacterium]